MSGKQRRAPPDQVRTPTSLKLDLLNAAIVDDEMTAGQFRFFARVMQQLDLSTWTATLSDDRIGAEVPGCASRHTCNDHRSAIRKLGYWQFDPGSGRHPTRYFPTEAIPERVTARLAEKRQAFDVRKEAERAGRDVVTRPRKAPSRGGQTPPNTVVATPPVLLSSSPYQQARRLQDETPGSIRPSVVRCGCGQVATHEWRARGGGWRPECEWCQSDRFPDIGEQLRPLRSIPECEPTGRDRDASGIAGAAYRAAKGL